MPAAFIRVAMAECTPGTAGSYQDVDANSYDVPAGAVGVWVRCANNYSTAYDWDVRKNGSTDAWGLLELFDYRHTIAYVGIDANGIFEAWVEHNTRLDLYVMGYMTAPVTMNTDATDVSTATAGSYVDVDVSVSCPAATMVLLSITTTNNSYSAYTRKNGSTDDRYADTIPYLGNSRGVLTGVDASQIFEQEIENAACDLYVQGYYAGTCVTAHTNATDRSTATTGAYEDIAALGSGALVGFYEVVNTSTTAYDSAMRKNGESEDPYAEQRMDSRTCWIVECDVNRVGEQKIENVAVDVWEMGYAVSEVVAYTKTIATATASTVGAVPRQARRNLLGTVSTVGTLTRGSVLKKALTATASAIGSVTRSTVKILSGLAATVGTMRPLTVGKALEGTSSASGTVKRATSKAVGLGTVETVGTLTRGSVVMKALAVAAVEVVGTVGRAIGKNLTGVSATVGTVGRAIARTITGTASTVGAVPRAITKAVAAGTVATVGSLIRGAVFMKAIAAGIVSTVGTVAKSTGRILKGTATAVGLSIRPLTVGKVPLGTVGTVGTMRPISVTRAITGTVGTVGVARRAITRTIATAVVSTVGTIWATAGQVLSGGASVVATVSRKVFRTIRAQVGTIGTVTDILYDIVYAMNQTFRKLYAKVRITYTDPYFSAGVATAADAVGDYTYTDQTVDNVMTEDFKWFSLHRNVLDGTFHPLPGDQSRSVGWWGTQLSDSATHVFVPTYPKLTLTHAARTVESILVVGDDKLNEYPVDFTVKLYDAANVLQHTQTVTGNSYYLYDLPLSPTHTGIAKQELEITKWSRGDSVCKIAQFFTMLEETYLSEDGELVTVHVTEQREFTGTTIPQGNLAASEITVRLNNIDGTFDPGNTGSRLYGLLKNNRAIEAWLGVDLIPSGVRRWYPLGVFYSRDWNAPDAEIYAEVSGQDMLSRLQTTTYSTSQVYTGESLQDLAIRVMTDAGLTSADWIIDAGYDAITIPYAWFDQMTHREALRRIAAAALGQCYCDRDGKVVLDIYTAPTLNAYAYTTGNVFEFDRPLAWTQMINYVETRATPRELSAEQDIVVDTEVITIPAGSTKTKTHFFTVSPCQDIVAPVIVGGADVTVSAYSTYSWGISITYANAGAAPETVTSVTVRGKTLEEVNKRICVAQDADSIGQNGKQTLPEVISSEFWQSETRAQEVADALLVSYRNPRRDLVMRARGNIAQLLGDRVTCMDSRLGGTTAQFGIVGQDISYDGGLEILVTAQQLGARTDKTLLATVGTVGTMIDQPSKPKHLSVATAVTVGSVRRVIGKILAGTVGTVGSVGISPALYYVYGTVGELDNENAVFNTAWTAASATGGQPFVGMRRSAADLNYYIYRRPHLIDTTLLPVGATITAAEFWFKAYSKTETAGAFNIVIQNGQPTYPHDPVVVGDYAKANYSGDGGSIASSAITVDGWYKITLNATGLTWIQKGAATKLCLRTSLDIAGTAPGTGLNSTVGWVGGGGGTGYKPYLKVWYTI